MENGLVTAVGEGATEITITYGDHTVMVSVNVKAADVVILSVDKTQVSLKKGNTIKVKVKEVTTTADGLASEIDVTEEATYVVADEKVATVKEGLVTAKAAGKTKVTVKHGTKETIFEVTVTNPSSGGGGGGNTGPSNPIPEPEKPTPPVPAPITFKDIKGHWAESYIQKSALLGLLKGYPDGTFKPENPLTRAQAASLIVRALKLETTEAAPFKDIEKYATETKAELAAAYKFGIIKGDRGKFKPSEKVTRAQLALMIERAYAAKTGKKYTATKIAPFSDIAKYDEETINAISMLYELQVVDGSDGKFKPADPTTRAHAAKIFTNFLGGLK